MNLLYGLKLVEVLLDLVHSKLEAYKSMIKGLNPATGTGREKKEDLARK